MTDRLSADTDLELRAEVVADAQGVTLDVARELVAGEQATSCTGKLLPDDELLALIAAVTE